MELIGRQKITPVYSDQPGTPDEFRIRQLRARDMLRGELEGEDLQQYVEERVLMTNLESLLNWGEPTRCSR